VDLISPEVLLLLPVKHRRAENNRDRGLHIYDNSADRQNSNPAGR
jgi:hypothetical protein